MPDNEIVAALEYMNAERMDRINAQIQSGALAPQPTIPTAAEVIAARTWAENQPPPLLRQERDAALKILASATETQEPVHTVVPTDTQEPVHTVVPTDTQEPVHTVVPTDTQEPVHTVVVGGGPLHRRPIEGGAGGTRGSLPPLGTGPSWSPSSEEIVLSFLRWAFGEAPTEPPNIPPSQKLNMVTAALQRGGLSLTREKRLFDLQAWYYFQVRALQAQGIDP